MRETARLAEYCSNLLVSPPCHIPHMRRKAYTKPFCTENSMFEWMMYNIQNLSLFP